MQWLKGTQFVRCSFLTNSTFSTLSRHPLPSKRLPSRGAGLSLRDGQDPRKPVLPHELSAKWTSRRSNLVDSKHMRLISTRLELPTRNIDLCRATIFPAGFATKWRGYSRKPKAHGALALLNHYHMMVLTLSGLGRSRVRSSSSHPVYRQSNP